MIIKKTGAFQTAGLANEQAGRDSGLSALAPGNVLQDRYEIISVLGHGGMSTVYRARDRRFTAVERLVAIKEMFNVTQDAASRRLRLATFEREANLLATLQHSAIPKIFDFFHHEGRIYLVLEMIIGENLETVLERRGNVVPEKELADWTTQICELLTYLHSNKPDPIVFRDMKPSNIMLRDDGKHIVMVDFGIARTFQSNQRGTMIGTEGYAPPEQYRGLATTASDIYALGATMHHLGTGNDPRLETPFTFHQRPPRQLNPVLSEAFETIILKAVSYNANHRYATTEEMRLAVVASQTKSAMALRFTGALSTTPAPAPAAATPTQTHVTRTIMATPVLAPAAPAPAAAVPAPSPAGGAMEPIEQDASHRVKWVMRTGDEVRGTATIEGERVYVGSYDGNLYALNRPDGAVLWRASAGRGVCSTPAVTDKVIVYGSEDSAIYAVDRGSGKRAWAYRTGLPVRSSPRVADGFAYVGSDDGYVYCLDVKKGSLVWRSRTWSHVRSSPTVVDKVVVVGSDDGYVYAIDRESGTTAWRFQVGAPVLSTPTLTADLILVTAMNGLIYGLRPDSGERAWQVQTSHNLVASIACKDGVGYVGNVGGLFMAISLADGEHVWQFVGSGPIASTAAVDDHWVYFGSNDTNLRCLRRSDGHLAWQLKTGGPIPASPVIANGMLYVGSNDRSVYALAVDSEIAPSHPPAHSQSEAHAGAQA